MMTKLTLLMAISVLPSLVSPFTTPNTFGETSLHLGSSIESSIFALFSEASVSKFSQDQDDVADDIEDSYLVDNANSTSKFLCGLWELIARGNSMVRGESETVLFPDMESQFTPRYLNLVTAHLDGCKDVTDNFGVTTTLQPYISGGKVKGFTVKSFRNPDKDPDNYEFDYDPFWDDGDDWNYEGVDDEDLAVDKYPEIVDKIPDDDDKIIDISKAWVEKICSDMGICPFSKGAEEAGLPIGPVFYCIDRCTSLEDMYARYWAEVVRVENQDQSELSTTLLVAPEFCIDQIEIFEQFSTTLTQPLSALDLESSIQLVFFHPNWSFRDGSAREGIGAAANYARRSPWPMINILRTSQVRAAQKGIPTGLVYKQNEKTLSSVGVDTLETCLRLRDWEAMKDVKVNRKEIEALRVARDFQESGTIKVDDTSFSNDATPAANKVDGRQIEQGDLVNVVLEALSKRLSGSTTTATTFAALSGPETSAAIMATDFLLKELNRVADSGPEEKSPATESHQAIVDDFEDPASGDGREDLVGQVVLNQTE
ncbi:unnamed protein product [Cylindrotheca closterium]|uniref:Uncharacterized protein n=1 Tax=Cylindrotheca closterium TaxID=2856 RepID=A0AAD2G5V0_9STRA|nr:unnamed protein product [Cylindrotheca closterium]